MILGYNNSQPNIKSEIDDTISIPIYIIYIQPIPGPEFGHSTSWVAGIAVELWLARAE